MRIERLHARHFRNLTRLDIVPGPGFNVLSGDNGAGKTSVLEAIDCLLTFASFRSSSFADLMQQGSAETSCAAQVVAGQQKHEVRIQCAVGKTRSIVLNGKRPRRKRDWCTQAPRVMFHPGELRLASGGPEARRGFLDALIERTDPLFADARDRYDKALRSRNRLLKLEGSSAAIQAFDVQLAQHGARIGQARAQAIDDLREDARDAFATIFEESLEITLAYRSRVAPSEQAIREALARALPTDRARGYTGDGPHGDDIDIALSGRAAKKQASQGQQRVVALALKFAELRALQRHTARVPLVLLDDVSSELDKTRSSQLFAYLRDLGGQVFLTTTHPEYIALQDRRTDFRVQRGEVTPTSARG